MKDESTRPTSGSLKIRGWSSIQWVLVNVWGKEYISIETDK